MIDPNETPEVAALRELKEETGYTGIVTSCSPFPTYLDTGLSSASIYLVTVEIDEDDPANDHPKQIAEDEGSIQIECVATNDLLSKLSGK